MTRSAYGGIRWQSGHEPHVPVRAHGAELEVKRIGGTLWESTNEYLTRATAADGTTRKNT